MPDKLYKTKGIVLRTVKYGETSLIVSIFTETFGLQSYLINGVRSSSKKGSGRANLFQPSAILELIVYHNELKHLQRIKEFKWSFLYQQILTNVPKNAVALFMVELLTKSLKQPEAHADLFHFCEDALVHLDVSSDSVMANFPLFFSLHLTTFLGFRMEDDYSEQKHFFDLKAGKFVSEQPTHSQFLSGKQASSTSELLKVMQPFELEGIKLNHNFRRELLFAFETFYKLHIPDFGTLKSLPVLRDILE